jgi:peptidoglycan/xylan/chitin deacetylase (PgdA/CDA1 family)
MILCYHGVSMQPAALPPDERKQHIPVDLFISQLEYLKRHYHPISLKEYLRARKTGEELPDNLVVLTFDDGFRNFLTVAAPLLIERYIPATAFVITEKTLAKGNSTIKQRWVTDDDNSYLSWPEVEALAQESGIEFGSHTYSHPRLTQIEIEDVERELRDSHAAIAEHLGYESMALAFPYGETTDEISRLATSLGYSCALTGTLGPNEAEADIYQFRRTVIASDDDLSTFAARVSGFTWWGERSRAFIKQAVSGLFEQSKSQSQQAIQDQADS